jgi:hypothetical protein
MVVPAVESVILALAGAAVPSPEGRYPDVALAPQVMSDPK